MGKGNFLPPTESTPLNRSPKICHSWLRRRHLQLCQIRCIFVHGGLLGTWVKYNQNYQNLRSRFGIEYTKRRIDQIPCVCTYVCVCNYSSQTVWFSLTKTKTKTKKSKTKRILYNADNSSLKAALRRLADCAPETRIPVFRFWAYDDDNDDNDNHE